MTLPKMLRSFPILVLLVIHVASSHYLVATGPRRETRDVTSPLENSEVNPTIRSLRITSDIKYRYATTLVSTRVINPSDQSGEATFTVTLPESAFISEFLMVIKDKVYKAYVKEKEEAKAIYQDAVQAGQFAGHVALDARDSNQFTVSVNIEAHGKVTFNLTYEQLLSRNLGVYSNVININPHQIVEDMSVTVNIEEPTAIVDLEVPELQVSNEAIPEKHNKDAKIEEKSPNHMQVTWAPTPDDQRRINSTGLSGQFIVKYDVNREGNPQQILVDEGYFVHFFAPENLPKLRKHVIFVLDFSGSMSGRKLDQLKEAMKQIFSDLSPKDYFSIVVFQSWVEVWSPNSMYITSKPEYLSHWEAERIEAQNRSGTLDSRYVVEASPANIELARTFMQNYTDLGSTNIMGGLRTGLELVEIGEKQWENESEPPQPMLVFLTDGQPNVEEYDTNIIIDKTKVLNTKESPIFGLAFGYGADFNFLRKLSLQNFGFARNIYEAADATQQLKNFYKTIASPLLSNVTFSYLPGQVDNSSNTKQEFPVFFSGSELVVAGRINKENNAGEKTIGELRGITANGPQTYPIIIDHIIIKPKNRSIGHLEKAWSYLTIQQLLDKSDALDDGEEKNQTRKKALDLALQYAFVTPLTSLVVVKPNETESSVDATKVKPGLDSDQNALISGGFVGGGFPAAFPASNGGGFGAAYGPPSTYSGHMLLSLSTRHPGSGGYARRTLLKRKFRPLQRNQQQHHRILYDYVDSYQPVDSLITNFSEDVTTADSAVTMAMEDDLQKTPSPQKVSLETLKWLQQPLNGTDSTNTVTVEGVVYKLGMNETDSAFGDCQVNGDSGECHHLQYCALDVFEESLTQFLPYKCSIPGDFLGVCCPRSLTII